MKTLLNPVGPSGATTTAPSQTPTLARKLAQAAPPPAVTADDEALHCPSGFDGQRLHDAVVAMYERVSQAPLAGEFHFHVGTAHAVQRLGYDAADLAALPAWSTERFAGVGNPLLAGPVHEGAVVLDHACGAGTDLLLAARRAGATGRAYGVDLTAGMRAAAQAAADEVAQREAAFPGGTATAPVQILPGRMEALPLADSSVDVVLSNGVLNLSLDKLQVLREAWRVLRPGGALYLADVVTDRPLSDVMRRNATLWAACIGGALTESQLMHALRRSGFEGIRLAARHEPFAGTALPLKLAGSLQVFALTVAAFKPPAPAGR